MSNRVGMSIQACTERMNQLFPGILEKMLVSYKNLGLIQKQELISKNTFFFLFFLFFYNLNVKITLIIKKQKKNVHINKIFILTHTTKTTPKKFDSNDF